ncbi:MAG: protein SCAI [Monoraphidium minutum]|nr:MAG: protein SCAI [Monoraphidium minutum]
MSTREIFREFEFLLDKSQKSFNKLRDLPPYGNSRWEHHFHKAFHIYSKLWKFQQDNREVLTSRGMERWEIGDIASKIGQLYYNYYLRTSEIRFLHESYVFYEAIRSRSYFAASATDPNLAIKQLRYFARFIIICLLLNRREEVWQLLQEFQALISSYVMKYAPPDAAEWRAVIAEVTGFLNADVGMPAPRAPGAALPFRASLRCGLNAPEVKLAPHRAMLLHAVLASYYPRQVKIAELPLDSFRMLQALEWEDAYSGTAPPQGEHPMPLAGGKEAKGAGGGREKAGGGGGKGGGAENGSTASGSVAGSGSASGGGPSQYENPSKHLVYRPTSMQLLSILTTTVELLPRDGLLLLYLSAASGRGGGDLRSGGAFASTSNLMSGEIAPHGEEGRDPDCMSDVSGISLGALAVTNGGAEGGLNLGPAKAQDASDAVLLPEDIAHLTRRSLFLVVDADNAHTFARLQGQEVSRASFCLMSPSARPAELGDASKTGGLLTLFLSGPLMAFCIAAGNTDPSVQQLVDLQATMNAVMGEWGALLLRAFQAPGGGASRSPWSVVFRDALMRRVVLRYILARAALGLHTSVGTNPAHLPRCYPDLPKEAAPDAPEIAAGVARLAACLGRAKAFGKTALSVGSGSPMSASTAN